MTGISRHFELDLLNSHSEPPFGFPVYLLSNYQMCIIQEGNWAELTFAKSSGTVPIDRENNCQ